MLKITIKAARINSGMTLKEASNSAKITPEVLRNYESGRTVIPAHVFNYIIQEIDSVHNVRSRRF